jgi:hypothetical protein
MKKLIIPIFNILVIVCSCKPIVRDCCMVAQRPAGITALKNGVAWNPTFVNGTLSDLDSLKIAAMSGTVASATFVKADTLNIKLSYIGAGTYNLTGKQVFYATFSNGVTTSYTLDPSYNNQLKITSAQNLDNAATTVPNFIKLNGTFDIKFIDPNNPAGLSISNATFYTVIER